MREGVKKESLEWMWKLKERHSKELESVKRVLEQAFVVDVVQYVQSHGGGLLFGDCLGCFYVRSDSSVSFSPGESRE